MKNIKSQNIWNLVLGIYLGFSILGLGFKVFAQENDLFLVVSPSSPAPNQGYSVEAKSYQFDASRAYFEWFKDGKKIDEGNGITQKTFSGEKLGAQTKIIAVTVGNSASAQINVNDIDFIINPLAYTPPFYRGSPLPTSGSVVEIYTVPHIHSGGSRISPQNLIFEWTLDGNPIREQSGKGKNKFIFALPKTFLGVNEVTLKASSLNGAISHEKRFIVEMRRPEIILYKQSSLLGKSALAFSSFETKSGEEFAVAAEPFFFDIDSLFHSTLSWFTNGSKISSGQEQNPFLLELSSQSGSESENNISFKIENEKNVFQKGEGKINIKIK
ncbi:MAG TPA: hypothetical protein VJH05_00885 [Candidatus Paceibacterota bacterium]